MPVKTQLGGKELGGETISIRSQSVIDALPRIHLHKIDWAVRRATGAMLKMQYEEGFWWAELESNVTITAEYIMLHRFLGLDESKVPRMVTDILEKQLENGGWSIWHGDGGELSTTVEAYLALKMAGLRPDNPHLVKARKFILSRGGALKTRVFTRIFLALFGQVSWDGIPLLPVEFILLPPWSGLSIYEFSSWSRLTVVPLMIIMAKRPVHPLPPEQGVAELFSTSDDPFSHHRVAWKREAPLLENAFIILDRILKLYAWLRLPWPRNFAIKQAEKWILEHQEDSGDWGGIQPPMVNSLIALKCLGYDLEHDVVQRGLEALEFFTLEEGDRTWLHSCISPVWDTALAIRALAAAGVEPSHPAMAQGTDWLLSQQIFKPGDWSIKCPDLPPGGWAFEFVNNWYPDVDDSSMVLAALKEGLADTAKHEAALQRGINWCLGMQSKNGGFASFDKDNTKEWLNAIPFGDLKALVDPPTEDITARILEMMGAFGHGLDHPAAIRALAFLHRTQRPEGSWWGRWGVNYLYGTWSVLMALKTIGEDMSQPYIRRAVNWVKNCQNPDGGWGEVCETYRHPELMGQGPSTASQTAWALMGLIAAGEVHSPEVKAGVDYLVKTQNSQGRWDEEQFTGTGFPNHFMIRYHLYRDCFPLMALGSYLRELKNPESDRYA
ncbi:MAG: squalene--hopene cyclase [Deltaproteobacteria bacterium]